MNQLATVEKFYRNMNIEELRNFTLGDIEHQTRNALTQTRAMARITGDQMRALAHAVLDEKNAVNALDDSNSSMESLELNVRGEGP